MKNGLNIDEHGTKQYCLNNKLHRVDGPAIEYADGSKHWYVNGKKHRKTGPAVELADGSKIWYINGEELIHPTEFETMDAFFQELNDNEEYSLQWISDFNGIINMIKKPSDKQTRLHAMRWKI